MLFFLSIMCIFTVLVHLNLRTDCYASLSDPVIYIKFSHYFPTGPLYLYIRFAYSIPYFFNVNTILVEKAFYHFKRINYKCTPSILFTILKKDFKRLDAYIEVYLYATYRKLANIKYSFYRGFKPGFYEMFDETHNFAVHVQILDFEGNYLNIVTHTHIDEVISYRKSVSGKYNEICVITETNPAVVLKPIHKSDLHLDYIIGIEAKIFQDGKLRGAVEFLAFECNKNDEYSDKPVLFITDSDTVSIEFYIVYFASNKTRFELNHPEFQYAYKLQNFPQKYYRKLFLLIYTTELIKCPDKSIWRMYLSKYKIIIYGENYKNIYISNRVKFFKRSFISLIDICT